MCHNNHELDMFLIDKMKEVDGIRCPKCGCEAEARPEGNCFCNYCGYEGERKGESK